MDIKSTDWTRLRPKKLIDRKKEVEEIEDAFESGSKVVYLLGKGGIGKTRILEEVCKNRDNFVTLGIFDVYHPDYHKVSGVEQAIVRGVVRGVREHIDRGAFENYKKFREDYSDAREKGMSSISLEELRRKVAETFWEDFEKVIGELGDKHLMLCFDTMELLFHETDEVEALLGERPRGLELADWLKEAMERDFPNLHFLLSGRPQRDWWETLSKTRKGKEINLGPLDKKGVAEYLNSIGLGKEDPEMVYGWTRGEPLRLVFVTILRASGINLPAPPVSDDKIDEELINQVMNLTDDTSLALPYIAFLSKGVTPEILSRAMSKAYGDEWNEEKAKKFLAWFRNMPFVKIRPSDDRIFLHDEMYRVMRQYVLKGMKAELAEAAEKVVEYYREHEDLQRSEMVYYLLYKSWQEGFDEYRKLSDEAIAGHRTGDDLLLRDDLLRFVYDYSYTNLLPQITKDAAPRWIRRLLAMGLFDKAVALAQKVRERKDLWDSLDEPGQLILQVYEWEAKIYQGKEKTRDGISKLEDISERLETIAEKASGYDAIAIQMARIRAFNDIGYIYSMEEERTASVEYYRKAILGYHNLVGEKRLSGYFGENILNIRRDFGDALISNWADTLKNMAFSYAKSGHSRAASLLLKESRRMYAVIDNTFGLGLVHSTFGAVYVEREWYCNATRNLEEALHILGGLASEEEYLLPKDSTNREGQPSSDAGIIAKPIDERGAAMAAFSLARALRKFVDMENLPVQKRELELLEERHFAASERYLNQAKKVFEKKEPKRLTGVYQEFGCLYRDWLAFRKRTERDDEQVKESWEKSKDYFDAALVEAKLPWKKAEIYVDTAELYYHFRYKKGYGAGCMIDRGEIEREIEKAKDLVPDQSKSPYDTYPKASRHWWKVMGQVRLLEGHVHLKCGEFNKAIEDYLESFLYFDLFSEESVIFSVSSSAGARLYSKFSRLPLKQLETFEKFLQEVGDERRIGGRTGYKSLLSIVKEVKELTAPYMIRWAK